MQMKIRSLLLASIAPLSTLLVVAIAAAAEPLPRAKPEAVGMSAARLARIDQKLKADIDNGRIPGAVVAIARNGKLVYLKAFGYQDKAAGVPMSTDTIFSIASMTKPMVAVGTMMLFEDGRMMIGDPVSKYLPELGKMPVAVARGNVAAGASIETVPAKRQMTIHDLLRHTSGLLYGGRGTTALHKLYPAGSVAAATGMTAAEFIDRIAALPLAYQPGTVWDYSLSMDVLGLVLEKASGAALGAYLKERIFTPLKMADTAFIVPPEKASRYARPLLVDPNSGAPQQMLDSTKPVRFECGGGCAVSTAGDYIRFAQMLLNGGTLEGVRILSPKTVEFMVADHLGPEIENNIVSTEPQRAGYGFGLGVAVRRQTGVASTIGSTGDYFWNGAFGTAFWVDPKEQLAVVMMLLAPGSLEIRQHYRQMLSSYVMQAIEK
jgi:CubicO group peptidase (beta-lactamase class C family)